MNEECLGLPGSGKSTFINSGDCSILSSMCREEALTRSKPVKIINTVIGAWKLRRTLVFFIPTLMKTDFMKLKHLLKMWLVLFERFGQYWSVNSAVDEGVFQAIWGIFFRTNISEKMKYDFMDEINFNLSKKLTMYYIMLSRQKHLQFYMDRIDKRDNDYFHFLNDTVYQNARKNMQIVLCQCKRSDRIKLKVITKSGKIEL